MPGLIISFIYSVLVYFIGEPTSIYRAFTAGTEFLFWWYVITTVFMGFILFQPLVIFLANRVCFIFGAYLLHNAIILRPESHDWNTAKIIFGGLLILLGIVMSKKSNRKIAKRKQ